MGLTRSEALALLGRHREEIVRRFHVRRLSLFGSVARDEAGPNSDLDVLVDFERPPTFDDYTGLMVHLEDLFGRKVDVVSRSGMKPGARPFIERDLIDVT